MTNGKCVFDRSSGVRRERGAKSASPERRRARLSWACFGLSAITAVTILTGCSASQSHSAEKKNTVSPYDREFDPDKPVGATPESVDTPEVTLLDQAKEAYDRGLYTVAKENWQKLHDGYPTSPYSTLAELKLADCSFYSGDYPAAATAYEEFIKLHPGHESAAYAHYQLGRSYQEQYTGPEHDQAPLVASVKHYQTLIDLAPEHEYATLARKGIAECRERLGQHELVVAKYYQRQEMQNAELGRLRIIVAEYPETRAARDARERMAALGAEATSPKLVTTAASRVSTPPAAPRLVYRAEPSPGATPGLFSSPLASLKSEIREQQLVPAIPTLVDAPGTASTEHRLVQALTCETVGQFSVATAYLSQRLEIGSFREPRAHAAVSTVTLVARDNNANFESANDAHVSPATAQSCTLGDLTVTTAEANGSSPMVTAAISGVADRRRIHLFPLDRPNRFIVLVDQTAKATAQQATLDVSTPVVRSVRRVALSESRDSAN